jgi:hypothetical protein
MSDYISNSNQSRIIEQLADQDGISLLRDAEIGGSQGETQDETPSFCELVSQKKLIEIVLSDEFCLDFVHRNDAQSRQQLDACGTESQTILFWEKVCQKFNHWSVIITSCPLDASWGHEIFLEIHDCNRKELDALGIEPIPDENSCKKHYTSLNNKLGSIYKNWHASGNGDNQVMAGSLEEAEYGTVNLETLPTQGGDRIDFLGNYNICVMYLWFSLIKVGAFLYSQTEFPTAFQADDGIAPKITKRGHDDISIRSSSRSTSSRSSSTRNKKVAAVKVKSEIKVFTRQIDQLNSSMLLDSRLDHLVAKKNDLNTQLNELRKEIDTLYDKKHHAEVKFKKEQDENLKPLKQESQDRWWKWYAEAEQLALVKEKQIEDLEKKERIIKSKLYEIQDKTPKRSGNSSKEGGRRVAPPSSIVITDDIADEDRVAGLINFDTPAAATTPTATTSQINSMLSELNNKRKHTEEEEETPESVDLLAQQETQQDYYDDDNDKLLKKVL